MTHIVVTGASGFVGRHVLQALRMRGCERVTAVSRAEPGAWLPEGMHHVRMDLASPPAPVFGLLGEPETLIHLAWGGLPNYRSRHHFETELPAHYRFLKALAEEGLGSMLCIGTCFEYGMRDGMLHESLTPAPHNAYALAKDTLRRQLELLRDDMPFGLTWARLFYMHGEDQPQNSLRGQFDAALQRGDTEFPMSGGEQLRDFLPVQEVGRLIAALALGAPDSGIVNVCAGKPISVRSLVEQWVRDSGWGGSLALGRYPYPAHEPMAFWGSDARLNGLLEAAA